MNITIIGAGNLGRKLAKSLSNEEHDVTIVDIVPGVVENLVDKFDIQGICGCATHINVLKEAGVSTSQLVIATTESDENNILICLMAKKLGARKTIARVRNPEYNAQFDFMRNELGISIMINPDFAAALEISRILQFPDARNIESFANGIIDMAEYKIKEGSNLAGSSIGSISSKLTNNMLICAVERGDDVFIPNGNFVLQINDKIHITGAHKELASIGRALINSKNKTLKNIMIIGGSRAGIYLSDMLMALGKNVVIIEKNRKQCEKLFDLIPSATIINGDANDHEFLDEEGLENMDAVVTLTKTDETNFLVSLYAQRAGITKTITKVKNSKLSRLLDDVGLDTIINISDITVSMITQYVRASENASSANMRTLYKLVDGKIEASEFFADKSAHLINKPISDLKIRKNVLIAAINRNNKIIFPGGNDEIREGDLVIIVSKDQIINKLNDILQ